jgi:excisionase family DNA binding protein
MQRFYTIENLAELFQVSTRTVLREKMCGKLPCVVIRGRIRFREEDVQTYLEAMQSVKHTAGSTKRTATGEQA